MIRVSVDGEPKLIDLNGIDVQQADEFAWHKKGIWVQKGSDVSHYFAAEIRASGSSQVTASGTILSPMPGRIIAVEVAAGQAVTKGQKLLTLEAMKMEHSLTAPFDGVVAELNAEVGAQVQVDAVLIRIEVT